MGVLLTRSTDNTQISFSNVNDLEAAKMSTLGQKDRTSINEVDLYKMMVELESLSVKDIDALLQEYGKDFCSALHVGQSAMEQNSDFSEVLYDPVRRICTRSPPPPPGIFNRRRAIHRGMN